MLFSITSSLSALHAYGQKLRVNADNIAHVNTNGYRRKTATLTEGAQGDVTVNISRAARERQGYISAEKPRHELTEPPSDVNLVDEIPSLATTQRAYEANLKAVQTEERMLGTLLNIFG